MAVTATIRKPAAKTKPPVIDVEATRTDVDENSADKLAAELEAGAPVPGSEEAADAEINGSRAVALRPNAAVAPVGRFVEESGGGLEGEFDQSDLKLPQLKIVNGSGELSQKFNQGTLLYSDEKIWNPPDLDKGAKNPTLIFVPVTIKKQWRENLTPEEVEDGNMPRMVNSRAEAEALTGEGTTQWVGGEKPRWSPSARCVFLLQAPEGCEHPAFCNHLDGKDWALAVYYAGGMGYNESAKQIFNAAQISLKEAGKIMLHKKLWTWQVVKKTGGKFTVFVPQVRLTKEETGAEVRELCNRVLGVRNIEAAE